MDEDAGVECFDTDSSRFVYGRRLKTLTDVTVEVKTRSMETGSRLRLQERDAVGNYPFTSKIYVSQDTGCR
jgi:hypothetical protein